MTPGLNHTILRKGIERNCCVLYRQQKPRSEKICYASGLRTKDQRQRKSPGFRTCLTFCFKDQERMEQREASADPHNETTEGRLKELASKWFIETQVPLIVHNGFFPTWFLGFITRKETEEMLRVKELGCFLIRLSDKAIGYILSYKGSDRCRHFVINQSESGQFIVCGDVEGHDTVSDLIEYYKTSPIQPFGEYLTSSCFEGVDEELYDMIQVSRKERPVDTVKNKLQSHSEQPPAPPARSNRSLEEVPPLPRRSRHPESGALNDLDKVLYAQLRKQSAMERPRSLHTSQDNFSGDNPVRSVRSGVQDQSRYSPPSEPQNAYSELSLLGNKSRSLPLLDDSCDEDRPPYPPPRLSPKPIRQATCFALPEKTDSYTSDSGVYHLAGRPGSPHTTPSGARYSQAPNEALHDCVPYDTTYAPISCHEDRYEPDSTTYESLEDMRPKHNHSSWGLKNDKWKWLFPEMKRKW